MLECMAHHNFPAESSMPLTGLQPVPTAIVLRSTQDPSDGEKKMYNIIYSDK